MIPPSPHPPRTRGVEAPGYTRHVGRRTTSLFLLAALVAVCLLLTDVFFGGDAADVGRSDAAGALDEAAWLEASDQPEAATDGASPTLAGRARDPLTADALRGSGKTGELTRGGGMDDPASIGFKGRVYGPDGRPVSGVTIRMVGRDMALAPFETGADGEFASEIPPGRYSMYFDGGADGGLILRSYMVDGSKSDELEFTLREPGTIAVNVKRGDEGVPGTSVVVTSRDLGALIIHDRPTDADGLATFEELPPGRYEVTAQVPDGPLARHHTWASSGKERAVNLRVPSGTVLKGMVRDGKEGPGVGGALVTLHTRPRRSHGVFETTFETNADGSYEIMVPRGKPQRITVQADGWAPWPTEKQRRGVLRSLRGLSGKKPVTRNVTLLGGAALTGLVQTEQKTPVPGLELRFKPRRGQDAIVTTKDDGTYSVAQLNPGRYSVQIRTVAYFPIRGQRMWINIPGGASPETQTLDVTVIGARKLEGTVSDAEGEAAPGVRVWIVGGGHVVRSARDTGRLLETFTDKKGRWVISDIPPDKNVVVRAAMGLLEADPVSAPWKTPPPMPIQMKLGATGTLTGTVVDILTRTTVRGARVVLRPDPWDGRTSKSARTNAQGEFTIKGLLPGTWLATPSSKGYLKIKEPERLSIPRDGETSATLRLDPGAVFSGTVVDANGKPIRWARVTVRGTPDGAQKALSRGANTNARGQFRITGIQHGSYTVTAWRKRYKSSKLGPTRGDDRMQFVLRK